jgi:hypothetical protein
MLECTVSTLIAYANVHESSVCPKIIDWKACKTKILKVGVHLLTIRPELFGLEEEEKNENNS